MATGSAGASPLTARSSSNRHPIGAYSWRSASFPAEAFRHFSVQLLLIPFLQVQKPSLDLPVSPKG